MCGRYTLKTPVDTLQREFELVGELPELTGRFNIAPTQEVPVVIEAGGRHLELVRWGLVPFWADDLKIGSRMINARAETVPAKPAFRKAYERRRCLVLADGFYEWKKGPKGKIPMYIHRRSGAPFAFAGLWEEWKKGAGAPVRSCTIVTTQANELLAPIHDRMPVILAPENYAAWLDPATKAGPELEKLLAPPPVGDFEAYPVSPLVNAAGNDRPECIEPAKEP